MVVVQLKNYFKACSGKSYQGSDGGKNVLRSEETESLKITPSRSFPMQIIAPPLSLLAGQLWCQYRVLNASRTALCSTLMNSSITAAAIFCVYLEFLWSHYQVPAFHTNTVRMTYQCWPLSVTNSPGNDNDDSRSSACGQTRASRRQVCQDPTQFYVDSHSTAFLGLWLKMQIVI